MEASEVDDFASALKVKLIENDYYVLRQYGGKSSLSTFLYVVIQRFYLDYRDRQWGRWRPSAEAQRHGEPGILLEQLAIRDGIPLEQACDVVLRDFPETSRAQLERIRARLPERIGRPVRANDGEHVLRSFPAPNRADDLLVEDERAAKAARISTAFARTLSQFTPEEQVILRMRFGNGLKIVTIATSLSIDAKRLYRTIDRLISTLRSSLIAEEISLSDIAELLEHGAEGIDIPFLDDRENPEIRPSNTAAKGDPTGLHRKE